MKDFTIECYNGKWNENLVYGIIGVLIYPLGTPMFFAWQLWIRREHLDDRHVLNRLGFLYAIYRRETYLWDIWEMIQKLFLTGIIGLIFPGKDLQVVVVVLFDLFFLCILLSYKPHVMGPIRILASLSSVAITLTMYCGLVLKTVEGIDSEVEYKLSIDLFLIFINVAVAVYAAKQIMPLTILIKTCKDNRKKKKAAKDHKEKVRRRRSLVNLSDTDKANTILRSLTVVAPKTPSRPVDKRSQRLHGKYGNTNLIAKSQKSPETGPGLSLANVASLKKLTHAKKKRIKIKIKKASLMKRRALMAEKKK